MLTASVITFALSTLGFAQAVVPAGYNKVYLQTLVDTKFVVQAKATTSGSTVVVNTVNNKADQHWLLTSNTSKIYLANNDPPTLCLDAGAKSTSTFIPPHHLESPIYRHHPANQPARTAAWKDMANVYVNTCSDTAPGQNWTVMVDGRIAVTGSSPAECLDLQYMRATANNPVGLYQCAGLNNSGAKDKGINWPQKNVTTTP
ncbi:carbohydrate-binding module family 13 protein [Karstenula rhodostoma CBS 690.94]|uniref:Carbohydrate-binding module family 13 protein n=1 Tax=Karstenula rhodostoma CBS 690.94 TaxID=1392251 RepID=A0A9P4PQF2_9PLEO|nr:carbohydrate-binding module family 13 protein [Karstenula rhodostoma CBS 690.94]